MKIFIDSARLDEIEEAYGFGIVDGVTTNPSLLKKAVTKLQDDGKDITIESYLKNLLKTAKGTPVSLEVTEYKHQPMVKQAKQLYKLFNPVANNVVIKVPVNPSFEEGDGLDFDGIKTIKELAKANIPVNCTLVFTPEQALLAAKAGAAYVSPFAGRIDDYIRSNYDICYEKTDYFPAEGWYVEEGTCHDEGIVSGIDLIDQILDIFSMYDISTEVIAASIRNIRQTREASLVGAHIATVPFNVIRTLLGHYKTREGMKAFTNDVVPEYVELTRA